MLVELARTTTADGVRLDGAFHAGKLDRAVLCIHGTASNFYGSSLFDAISERLAGLGLAVLRINTRGHDAVSNASTSAGGKRLGAAYECFDDCRHDIAGWLDWLKEQGYGKIALIGHSSGAVKALYSQAMSPDPAVFAIAAISPPRLCHQKFATGASAIEFQNTFDLAERHVQSGRPSLLMEVRAPLPMLITAEGYLEKYGPENRYDILTFLDRITLPVLVTFGSREVEDNVAFAGVPDDIRRLANPRLIQVDILEGANHFYMGLESELGERIGAWLQTVL